MKYLVVFLILTSSLVSYAQIFSAFDAGFEDLSGQVKWFDIDSDGDLDLLQRGTGQNPDNSHFEKSLIYINDGSGNFTKVENFFEDQMVVMDIKDFDGDGYVDFLISKAGFDPSGNTLIYKNNFVETGDIELIANLNDFGGYGFIIDFDNDGDQDVVFSGQKLIQGRNGGWHFKTAIYNNVGGAFVEMELDDNPFGYFTQAIRPIDFDLDGKMEIVLTGGYEEDIEGSTTKSVTRLYTVNGDSFEKSILDTVGIHDGNLHVLDINNDSYPEIIMTGPYWRQVTSNSKRREPLTRLYKNQNGSGFSIDMTHPISPTLFGHLAPADFDNNGFSDIAIIGDTLENFIDKPFGKLYSNIDGTFSELFDEAIPPLSFGSIEWGDFDNDNDLDLAISGAYESTSENNITVIYKNNGTISNTSPSAPSNLGVQLVNDRFEFTWDASNDNETNSDGLTYNWYLRTETDTIISSNSLASGKRKIVENGNLQYGKTHFLTRFMTPGNYYWGVQAIDNGFQGSPFSPEETFHVNFPPSIVSASKANQLEDVPFNIDIEDLEIADPDNTYPDEFSITIFDGENYSFIDNTITPAKDFFGELTIPIQVKDGLDESEIYEFTVTIDNVNDVPEITEQLTEISTYEETPKSISLNDFRVVNLDKPYPTGFELTILEGENYTAENNKILPDTDFYGMLEVLVKVNDREDDSPIFEVSVVVIPVNDMPEIVGQLELSTLEDEPFTIEYDHLVVTDPDNTYPDDFSIIIYGGENYSFNDNTITPAKDFFGELAIRLLVSDSLAISYSFYFIVTVENVNDIPVVVEQMELSTLEEEPFTIKLDDLIISDPDNTYPDDFSLIILDGENYSFIDNTVTPVKDFFGELTIPLQVKDGLDKSEIYEFTLTVENVNDIPVVEEQLELSTLEEEPFILGLDYLIVSDPDNTYPNDFSLIILDGENYSFIDNTITPAKDFFGELTIPLQVKDTLDKSDTFEFVVSVENVNDIPEITEQLTDFATPEDTPLSIAVNDFTIVNLDVPYPNGFELTIEEGENYSVQDGMVLPDVGFHGFLEVPVKVNDGEDDSPLFSVKIEVTPVNDIPEIIEQTNELLTPENTPIIITIEDLSISNLDESNSDEFELTILEGDNYTIIDDMVVPDADYKGTLEVPVSVSDGKESSNIFRVAIKVGNVVTSLLNIENKSISIYPNPFTDQLYFDVDGNLGNTLIQIISLSGINLQSIESLNFETQNSIDLRHLSDGFYAVKIIFEGKVIYSKKIIKLNNR